VEFFFFFLTAVARQKNPRGIGWQLFRLLVS
jgi:hypothetical protein